MKVSLAVSTLMTVAGVMVGMVIANPAPTLAAPGGVQVSQATPEADVPVESQEPVKQEPSPNETPVTNPTPEKPGHLEVKWQGDSLVASWDGSCASSVSIKIGAENWGYLPEPKDGIQAISGTSSGDICDPENGGSGVSVPMSQAVCYGFTRAWIQVDGKTDDAGLQVLDIPASVICNQ